MPSYGYNTKQYLKGTCSYDFDTVYMYRLKGN